MIGRNARNLTLSATAALSLLAFTWPLFIAPEISANLAQTLAIVVMPLLVLLALQMIARRELGSKQVALLAGVVALNSIVRMLGAGVEGIETIFFLIILTGYVFRAGFGYLVGALSILCSALIGSGIGPWMPFQMMAAGLVGLGAGLLPRLQKRWIRTSLLVGYATVAAYFYGGLMTLWNWPWLAGSGTSLSYIAGAGAFENLKIFVQYEFLTGGLLWDTGRAITTVVLVALTTPALLPALSRAANRAGFKTD
ncbi:MAG: hypothetical protein RLZZ164_337 [Actinomycetota bacterium]|jgi:energy-coupling factor transport system substrate-specific component